jgi:signal peptidase I
MWVLVIIAFIVYLAFYSQSDSSGIFPAISLIAIILLLPVWGFLVGRKLMKIISILPLSFVILFYLFYFSPLALRPHKVIGSSMEPNFTNGEYVLSEDISYYFGSPKRGDVVIFHSPVEKSEVFARIVGLPGEYISIKNGDVYINNFRLEEPYLAYDTLTENVDSTANYISESNVLIPNNEYAILGDNREYSADSRSYGFIDKDSIIGKMFYVYWPSDLRGFIKSDPAQFLGSSSLFPVPTCRTLGTKMIIGEGGMGEIGCDIKVSGKFDLSKSYCQSKKTHIMRFLMPDAYGKVNQYYATLTGLNLDEEVEVFIYSLSGQRIECFPSLNKN